VKAIKIAAVIGRKSFDEGGDRVVGAA